MSNLNLEVSATGSQIGVSSKPFQNSSNYFTIYFLRSLSHACFGLNIYKNCKIV